LKKYHYTGQELKDAAIADLINDAVQAEDQAENGPFYPERGITKESLLAYAKKCRQEAEA